MNEWWLSLSALQQVMFVIGAATLLFMIAQIVMMLIGLGEGDISTDTDVSALDGGLDADADVDIDADADIDADVDTDADTHSASPHGVFESSPYDGHDGAHETDTGMEPKVNGFELVQAIGARLLSLRCLIVFFCFGAWTVFIFDSYLDWYFAIAVGVGIGFAAALLMAFIMTELMKLQRDGTVRIKSCIGKEGEVYLTVPARKEGMGKINIFVQERLKEFDAVTEDDDPIPTGEKVKVLSSEGEVLTVERVGDINRQSSQNNGKTAL